MKLQGERERGSEGGAANKKERGERDKVGKGGKDREAQYEQI